MSVTVCLTTYYVRDRTGELRPITTKTYIVNNLKHDLLSGKALNKAGYRIILDKDPEELGVFAVKYGKTCKSRSFLFMSDSKHSIFSFLKQNQGRYSNLARCRVTNYGNLNDGWVIVEPKYPRDKDLVVRKFV
jgi:hypothetical protein